MACDLIWVAQVDNKSTLMKYLKCSSQAVAWVEWVEWAEWEEWAKCLLPGCLGKGSKEEVIDNSNIIPSKALEIFDYANNLQILKI